MKRLILIRHGEAERDPPPGGGDFDRVLTDRGRHESTRAGVRIAEAEVTPDVALVSSAARTRETWDQAGKAWGAVETRLMRQLYNADAGALLAAAQAEEADVVALVAHNPGAQSLAVRLLRQAGEAEAAAKAERHFPTAAALVISFGDEAGAQVIDPADDLADN